MDLVLISGIEQNIKKQNYENVYFFSSQSVFYRILR